MQVNASSRVLAVLPELLADLALNVSPATVRQRDWALTSALEHLAAGTGTRGLAAVTIGQLLDPQAVQEYLAAAADGTLRSRSPGQRPTGESPRSLAARASALRWLAKQAHLAPPEAYRDPPELIPVTKQMLTHTREAIETLSAQADFYAVRGAAVMAMVWTTGLGSSQLALARTDQLHRSRGRLWVHTDRIDPLPRLWRDDGGDQVLAYAPPFAAEAINTWLNHRRSVVAGLQGSDHGALFVSARANAGRTPPGVPLKPRGLVRSHLKTLQALPRFAFGQEPPYSLETIRRAVWAYALAPSSNA